MPLVSVIMPAFNAEKFIPESINSVQAQTIADWELIIVDDGSTDNTATVVKEYVNKDKRIHYTWQHNGKQGRARNTGIRLANSPYLAFLDADDIWLPHKLEEQLHQIETTKADLVFSNAYMFERLPIDTSTPVMGLGDIRYNEDTVLDLFFRGNRIMILTVLVKREVVNKVNGFNEEVRIASAEDYHLWLKLLVHGYVFCGSSSILAAYRLLPGSSSSADRISTLTSMEALKDIAKCFPELSPRIKAVYKDWIKKSLGVMQPFARSEYLERIKSNFQFINFGKCFSVVRFAEQVMGRKISIRSAYFILNYF